MPRVPMTPQEGKEKLSQAIDRYLERVLRVMPEEKRKKIIEEIQKGRAIRYPRSPAG
ncbi:MAG: hypothetical protein ACXQTR_03405 [Candidatus Methanospirareceae archaeon]